MIRQTFNLMLAQVVGRLTGFLILLLMGNMLGSTRMGAYGTMLTMLMLATIVSTFGIDLWLTRHVANHPVCKKEFLQINCLKWGITLLTFVLYAFAFQADWLGSELKPFTASLVLVLGALFFDHVALTVQSILEGNRDLNAIAKLILMRWFVFALLGVASLIYWNNLLAFCASFMLASLARCVLGLYLVRPCLTSSESESAFVITDIFRFAAPMALLNTMVGLYFHIDMLMIPKLDSLEGAGFYKVAYTMVEALLFISGAFASSLFPLFSKKEVSFQTKWEQFSKGSYLLLLIAFPISFCTPLVSTWMIELFFLKAERALEFLPAASALNLLVWALPAMFINASLVRLFLGLHWQKAALGGVSLTVLTNIILNLNLIPKMGFLGAAVSTVVSEWVLCLFLMVFLLYRGKKISVWTPFMKPLLASLLCYPMAFFIAQWSVPLSIPITAVGYALFLRGTRLLTAADWKQFGVLDTRH
ncbi:MAG: hypothetical protein CR997_01600 [Acidobacteria bacterium]|nr:MAG: hypothetical protein CR997_01600 [Acidobacteriota bacterium]